MPRSTYPCAQCGTDVPVVGRNRADAERTAKWHEKQGHICPACEDKKQAAQNAAAAPANASAGLPALTGSEKQVAWAESIRLAKLERARAFGAVIDLAQPAVCVREMSQEALRALTAEVEKIDPRDSYGARIEFRDLLEAAGSAERYAVFLGILGRQVRASWWIDHRGTPLDELLDALARDIDAAIDARAAAAPGPAPVRLTERDLPAPLAQAGDAPI